MYVHIEQDGEEYNCISTAKVGKAPPIAIAKQVLEVALVNGGTGNDGTATVYAEEIDNGSYDLCTNIKLEIRRDIDICSIQGNTTYDDDGHPNDGSSDPNSPNYDSDDGAFVTFCCQDLYSATEDVDGDGDLDIGYVRVWLRVWDDADLDGNYGSQGDNYNETWSYVRVVDLLSPVILCPQDVTLTCDMDYKDLSLTGNASAFASCGQVDVEYNDIIVNLNACNFGFVRRRFNVKGRADITARSCP